jgi:hypothetical protein
MGNNFINSLPGAFNPGFLLNPNIALEGSLIFDGVQYLKIFGNPATYQ